VVGRLRRVIDTTGISFNAVRMAKLQKEILKKIVVVILNFVRKVPTLGRVCQSVTGIK
jgi:hypothetical protein